MRRLSALPRQKRGKLTHESVACGDIVIGRVVPAWKPHPRPRRLTTLPQNWQSAVSRLPRMPIYRSKSEELRDRAGRGYGSLRLSQPSTKPITLTVAFPLPDINLSDASNAAFPVGNPLNYVGFSTRIDGKPVSFVVSQQAVLQRQERDYGARRRWAFPFFPSALNS